MCTLLTGSNFHPGRTKQPEYVSWEKDCFAGRKRELSQQQVSQVLINLQERFK